MSYLSQLTALAVMFRLLLKSLVGAPFKPSFGSSGVVASATSHAATNPLLLNSSESEFFLRLAVSHIPLEYNPAWL
jgi:hypothetical protein